MRTLTRFAVFATALTAWCVYLSAQDSGREPVPVVVELFTSEGCSSCPPADALLRELDRTQPIAGASVIALSEHVDYWDDLGWKDTYSSHDLTLRQENYPRQLRVAGPYTPQMIVDGSRQFVGSDRAQAARALRAAASEPKLGVQIANVKFENGTVQAQVRTDALTADGDILIALVLDHAQSQVLRGENGGRRLEHAAVVEKLWTAGKAAKGERFQKDVSMKADVKKGSQRLVVLVQERNQGRILGAAVHNLPQ